MKLGEQSEMNKPKDFDGFEIGPIRPPSEASSLLVRVTRNCPWNKCTFCGLYKGTQFSIRSKVHVLHELELVKLCVDTFAYNEGKSDVEKGERLNTLKAELGNENVWAFSMSLSWYRSSMKSVFLQDANSLLIKPDEMIEILTRIRELFGNIERVTCYARSHTVAKISEDDLKRLADAGLNRIHIGMESASDKILDLVKKGVNKETHILAGQKVKQAGIELSEYFMPGLGGIEYSEENALETADALNAINPDFVRIRTLAVTPNSELYKDYEKGVFKRTSDKKMVEELLLLVKNLNGITSYLKSDHVLNLIQEVEGKFPEDREAIINALQWYLDLSKEDQDIYRLGRRTGVMTLMEDLKDESRRQAVLKMMKEQGINDGNIDIVSDELMNRFI